MMSGRDRASAALLVFFIAVAVTGELYFVWNHARLSESHSIVARGFALYARGDRAYYNHVTAFELGLETFNILFTQPLNLLILWGIRRRAAWRYPLQLGVCSYVCYSTVLYLLSNHLSGYAEMPRHDAASFAVFYLPNVPWVAGTGWMAWDAARSISAASRRIEKEAISI